MKKYIPIVIILILLIITYGFLYRETVITQDKVAILKSSLEVLKTQQVELKHKVSILMSPERIESLARTEYHMRDPKEIIIVEAQP